MILIEWVGGRPWSKTGATQDRIQLGLPDKVPAIKALFVCYSWDLQSFGLLKRPGHRYVTLGMHRIFVVHIVPVSFAWRLLLLLLWTIFKQWKEGVVNLLKVFLRSNNRKSNKVRFLTRFITLAHHDRVEKSTMDVHTNTFKV